MSFSYNANIPQATDVIASSQGQILTNFQSIGASNSWTTQDHYGFSTGTDGQHKQLNFPSNGSLGTMTSLASGVVTAPGSASNTTSQLFFKNATATVPISAMQAFAYVTNGTSATCTISNGYNVSSVTLSGTTYTVTLSITLPSANYAVIVTGGGVTAGVSSQTTSSFQLQFRASSAIAIPSFSFEVLQV